jgi:hypothetical protein
MPTAWTPGLPSTTGSSARSAREDARSRRLMDLPGIGPNTASALLASIGVRTRLQERPPGRGLDRARARAVQQRRGGPAWGGSPRQATSLYAQPPGDGRQGDPESGLGEKQDRFSRWAREALVERRGLLEGGGGDCRQECAAGLGGAALWRGFPPQASRTPERAMPKPVFRKQERKPFAPVAAGKSSPMHCMR